MPKLVCSGFLTIAGLLAASLPASGQDVWQLSQDSKWCGKQTVFVSPKIMRIKNDGFCFNSIVDQAQQRVDVYSDREKMRYKAQSIHTWGATIRNDVSALHDVHLNYYDLVWKKGASQKKDGLTFRKYSAEAMDGAAKVQAVAWVCEDIKTEPCLYKTLSNMYGFPPCQGIPTEVVFRDNLVGTTVLLKTTGIKKVKAGPDLFKVPQNYKPVNSAPELIIGGSVSSMVEDFANSLGDGVGKKPRR